jgi:hypothetical protein
MIIIATRSPTRPPSPNADTSAVMLPTTSPIMTVLPNSKPATIPSPNKLTKIDCSPLTNEPTVFIALSINEYLLSILLLPKSMKKLIFLHYYLHFCYSMLQEYRTPNWSLGTLRSWYQKKGALRTPSYCFNYLKLTQYYLPVLVRLHDDVLHDVHPSLVPFQLFHE